MLKKNKEKLVGFYLTYAYFHVLLEKTSRFYLIRCLTRLELRIYCKHALFYRLSHYWQAITCTNRLRQQEIWVRDYRPNIRLSTQTTPGIVTPIACIHSLIVSGEGNTTHTHRHCSSLTRFLRPHQAVHNWHAEKKKKVQQFINFNNCIA